MTKFCYVLPLPETIKLSSEKIISSKIIDYEIEIDNDCNYFDDVTDIELEDFEK